MGAHFLLLHRHPAKKVDKPAADGVELFLGDRNLKMVGEILDIQPAVDQDRAAVLFNEPLFFQIVFVLDVADDLLQQILDGHQPRGTAVLVDGDGHVHAPGTKLFQQLFDLFRFRNEKGGAHDLRHPEFVIGSAPVF